LGESASRDLSHRVLNRRRAPRPYGSAQCPVGPREAFSTLIARRDACNAAQNKAVAAKTSAQSPPARPISSPRISRRCDLVVRRRYSLRLAQVSPTVPLRRKREHPVERVDRDDRANAHRPPMGAANPICPHAPVSTAPKMGHVHYIHMGMRCSGTRGALRLLVQKHCRSAKRALKPRPWAIASVTACDQKCPVAFARKLRRSSVHYFGQRPSQHRTA